MSSKRIIVVTWLVSSSALSLLGCGNAEGSTTQGAGSTSRIQQALGVTTEEEISVIVAATTPELEAAIEARVDPSSFRPVAHSSPLAQRIEECEADPRVVLDLVSLDVCVGADLFFRETFAGNGRTCGSCHPAANNFALDPAFIASLSDDDPLFVAEQIPALAQLEKPALLRAFGLILENADGMEDPTQKFVMRAVPHTLAMGTSVTPPADTTEPPLERTGWSGDGAPGEGRLADFTNGAIAQHFTKTLNRVADSDFVLASAAEGEAVAEFMRTTGRTNELDLAQITLSDSRAEVGRGLFQASSSRCNGCHRNAGANVGSGVNRNFDTGVERLRIADLDLQNTPFDGGFGGQGEPAFNFDANDDGILDSFGDGTFNTTPLIEAADTAPFFHSDAFATIEAAIGFYNSDAFNQSPASQASPAVALSSTEIANIGRFLRVLNAALNIQMAQSRSEAALDVLDAYKNRFRTTQRAMLDLALAEVRDALAVLSAVASLNSSAQLELDAAEAALVDAIAQASHVHRRAAVEACIVALSDANAALGSGIDYTMGEGTLMM